MDEISDLEDVPEVELGDIRLLLRQEAENRVVEDDGYTLFGCLALCIKNLLLRITARNKNKTTQGTTIEDYTKPDVIKKGVVDLLSKHKKQFKSVLTILVDDIPPEVLSNSQTESKESEADLDTFYQRVIEDCKSDEKYKPYAKLCIYAAATCINTPIYILCVSEAGEMQWTYFKPLFKFEGQPEAVITYVTMFISSDNTFHGIESHDQSAPKPVARGLVGMYMSILEDTPEKSIEVPDELRDLSIASKSKLCYTLSGEMVLKSCELLRKKGLLNENDYRKMTAHRATRIEFAMFVTNSPDAFDIVCQVLLKRREKTILKEYLNNWTIFVRSCGFLAKFDALIELDIAIYERNIAVSAFVNSCIAGGQELDERRRRITTTVIASSSVGIVSGGMVIAGLILAPFSFGASLGLSIAGGAIGVGSGVAAGTARTVEAVKQNSKLNDIKAEQEEIKSKEQRVASALQKVEEYFRTEIANSSTTDTEGPGSSIRGLLAIGSALRAGHSIAGIALAAVRLGTTAAAVTASVLGPLSLVFDVAFLAEAAHNKHTGDKTNAGEMLHDMAETVDVKCKIFNSMLRGNCDEHKRLFEWA
ncbi:uncharacterized protein LOC132731886 [Ruditapes philippinarum]|uniref:uncharacterized protein LOC132731886 n=1 Tax=Ruditapes philippinarum TaxID=129788 RepID=UPI00295B05D9|nr:uncharacterized protein LOC132731886 [Ruditapes philippinarum]